MVLYPGISRNLKVSEKSQLQLLHESNDSNGFFQSLTIITVQHGWLLFKQND